MKHISDLSLIPVALRLAMAVLGAKGLRLYALSVEEILSL